MKQRRAFRLVENALNFGDFVVNFPGVMLARQGKFQQRHRRFSGVNRVVIRGLERILRNQQPVNGRRFNRRARLFKHLSAERFGLLEVAGQAFDVRPFLKKLERRVIMRLPPRFAQQRHALRHVLPRGVVLRRHFRLLDGLRVQANHFNLFRVSFDKGEAAIDMPDDFRQRVLPGGLVQAAMQQMAADFQMNAPDLLRRHAAQYRLLKAVMREVIDHMHRKFPQFGGVEKFHVLMRFIRRNDEAVAHGRLQFAGSLRFRLFHDRRKRVQIEAIADARGALKNALRVGRKFVQL